MKNEEPVEVIVPWLQDLEDYTDLITPLTPISSTQPLKPKLYFPAPFRQQFIDILSAPTSQMKPFKYYGIKGGRGSGKTEALARLFLAYADKCDSEGRYGIIQCYRWIQSSLQKSSLAVLKRVILSSKYWTSRFTVLSSTIRTKSGRISFAFDGVRYNLNSIRSTDGVLATWVEEAADINEESWRVILPTVTREPGAFVAVSYNPTTEHNPTEDRFGSCKSFYDEAAKEEVNVFSCLTTFKDNKFFPSSGLNASRIIDENTLPAEVYNWVWMGAFSILVEGAYYYQDILQARQDGRTNCFLTLLPQYPLYCTWDIGYSYGNANVITVWQQAGSQINILDCIAAEGQHLDYFMNKLNAKGYSHALQVLPHDGGSRCLSYQDELIKHNFNAEVIPNQGKGAAEQRIENTKAIFPNFFFNDTPEVNNLLAMLSAYREKYSQDGIPMGPLHSQESNWADSFGLIANTYTAPSDLTPEPYIPEYSKPSFSNF